MWNKEEKAEIAALQVIDCLFGTMQFSVRLDSMKEEHKRMLKNYMAFMQRHQELAAASSYYRTGAAEPVSTGLCTE